MATGDSTDILARLVTLLPGGWFARVAPVRDAILGGLSDALSGIYALIVAARAQTRIATATGWFLDLIAWDFFGVRFRRLANEGDDAFRARIIGEILRERATAKGIVQALTDLTGRPAAIFDLASPGQCGGGYGQATYGYGRGAGAYGSISYPNQVFLTARRPAAPGIPLISGYGSTAAGYGVGSAAYATLSENMTQVTDDDIYAAANDSAAAGIIVWTHIKS